MAACRARRYRGIVNPGVHHPEDKDPAAGQDPGPDPQDFDVTARTDQRVHATVPRKTFVDFDHTLLAANSTELFIAFCRPSLYVALIDFLIRRCLPWQVLPVAKRYRLRDYVCFVALVVLTPWNLQRWRRAAPGLFAAHRSAYVEGLIEASEDVVIISFGNRVVIEPMLRESRWSDAPLVATPLWSRLGHFDHGKTTLLRDHFEHQTVAAARFLTDSEEDRDLLDAVAEGIKIAPQGERHAAAERLYLPLRYTIGVKYARGYALDQFLLVDTLILALALVTGLGALPGAFLVAALMMLSMMCIYEIGYHENDTVGAAREVKPTLTASSRRFGHYPIEPGAWLCAAASGAAGVYLADRFLLLSLGWIDSAMVWIAVLLSMRLTFYAYNRLPPEARIYLYALLQMEKTALVFLLLLPTTIGMLLVASHVVAMWVIYLLYRLGARKEKVDRESLRFVVFAVLTVCLALSNPSAFHGEGTAMGLILGWSVLRMAKAPLMRSLRRARG